MPNVTLGSNPCRIRWFSQEIVIFRDDLMGRMMRNAVRFPAEEGGGTGGRKGDLRKAVSSTVWWQSLPVLLVVVADGRFLFAPRSSCKQCWTKHISHRSRYLFDLSFGITITRCACTPCQQP